MKKHIKILLPLMMIVLIAPIFVSAGIIEDLQSQLDILLSKILILQREINNKQRLSLQSLFDNQFNIKNYNKNSSEGFYGRQKVVGDFSISKFNIPDGIDGFGVRQKADFNVSSFLDKNGRQWVYFVNNLEEKANIYLNIKKTDGTWQYPNSSRLAIPNDNFPQFIDQYGGAVAMGDVLVGDSPIFKNPIDGKKYKYVIYVVYQPLKTVSCYDAGALFVGFSNDGLSWTEMQRATYDEAPSIDCYDGKQVIPIEAVGAVTDGKIIRLIGQEGNFVEYVPDNLSSTLTYLGTANVDDPTHLTIEGVVSKKGMFSPNKSEFGRGYDYWVNMGLAYDNSDGNLYMGRGYPYGQDIFGDSNYPTNCHSGCPGGLITYPTRVQVYKMKVGSLSGFDKVLTGEWELVMDLGNQSGYKYKEGDVCKPLALQAGQKNVGFDLETVSFLRTKFGYLHPDKKIYLSTANKSSHITQGGVCVLDDSEDFGIYGVSFLKTCTSDCSCASDTCIGETCSDRCEGTCNGTKECDVPTRNSEFVSQSVPATMTAGQIYDVSITMKNIGKKTWTRGKDYRLGSQNPMNNLTWGISRVYLDPGESVTVGQTKVFTFQVRAPEVAGTYHFQWKMLEELESWFGESTTDKSIFVKKEQTCTDTDTGKNYDVRGTANGKGLTKTDICYNPFYCSGCNLKEAYCSNGGVPLYQNYTCPNGCKDGACKPSFCKPDCSCAPWTCLGKTCSDGCGGTCSGLKVCITTSCTDTDGGVDYYIKGTANGKGLTKTDICYNPFYCSGCNLKEAYCGSDGVPLYQNYTCPNGCKDGVCQ